MQTFLPYPDFKESAKVLDYQRLGKQRVEVLQILKTLKKGPFICTECKYPFSYGCCGGYGKPKTTPWYNHPAVKMWEGYEISLAEYGWWICLEWKDRGYKDTCMEKIIATVGVQEFSDTHRAPPWLGNEDFHHSHRSNLLRKLPSHYRFYWPTETDDLPYVWPVQKETADN